MSTDPLIAGFAQAMAALDPPARLGLAVSGGSDSMALMHLVQRWGGATLHVATVDHGLRPEATTEAAMVGDVARSLGLPHVTLHWQAWDGRGNLQDSARRARLGLLRDWAARSGLDAILLGHTRDDQAETVLMRLARGSGVDGLAGMAARRADASVLWLRPLLDISRAELREWLRAQGIPWCDDPSNDDPRFDRIKARQALATLGLDTARLAETAQRMAEARIVLDLAASEAARRLGRAEHGDILFQRPAFDALPADTRHRLLAEALCQIGSTPYRPRLAALQSALQAPRATLHGCLITRGMDWWRVTREAHAVRDTEATPDHLWDNRWQVFAPAGMSPSEDMQVRALGPEGLAVCSDRAAWRLPRMSLLASPSVWQGTRLIAAPLAGLSLDWQVIPAAFTGILSDLPVSH